MTSNETIMCTVLLIVYNHAQYVSEAIESILNQKTTYGFEILINDDCSTDGSCNIIQSYVSKYPDIIKANYNDVNRQQNGLQPCEHILDQVQGKYLMILEGDDYWIDEYKIQKQIDFMESDRGGIKNGYYLCAGKNYILNCRNGQLLPQQSINRDKDVDMRDYLKEITEAYHTSTVCYYTKIYVSMLKYAIAHGDITDDGMHKFFLFVVGGGKCRVLSNYFSVYRSHSNEECYQDMYSVDEKVNRSILRYMKLDEMTDYIYHGYVNRYIEQVIVRLRGYDLWELLTNKTCKAFWKTYRPMHKMGVLFRLIIKKERCDIYGNSIEKMEMEHKIKLRREILSVTS